MIYECAVCKDYRNPHHEWYTPTTTERRQIHFETNKKISHGYCPKCFILTLKKDGVPESEIEVMLKQAEKQEARE